jgi:sarcosine oxidase subunit gamma
MTAPYVFLRRSPLQHVLLKEATGWRALPDAAIGEFNEPLPALGIADLSPLPRLGFKGRGTIEAMRKRGVEVESEPNRAFRQPDGGLCLVLAPSEIVLLSPLHGDDGRLGRMEAEWRIDDEERTYPIPRRDSHAWFVVTGEETPAMFAKICGIDLRKDRFSDLSIAQTSVARLTAIIVRADIGGTTAFHLLADSAAAGYFLACLRDAAEEFGGRMTGLSALEAVLAAPSATP